jgi:hypothetical protein
MSDFYIGYLPKSPAGLARRTRRTAIGLLVLCAAVAALLVFVQRPFAAAAFEFREWREFTGLVVEHPYPLLLVPHPGGGQSRYLLAAPGKHGAGDLVKGLAGRQVRLRAQLIYRDQHTMVELDPASIRVVPASQDAPTLPAAAPPRATATTLTGEIVDTKCYFGVMNPGRGKVHRDCAARCIAGGLPPALVDQHGEVYLLVGTDERALAPGALAGFVGEPVSIHGEVIGSGTPRLLTVTHIRRAFR